MRRNKIFKTQAMPSLLVGSWIHVKALGSRNPTTYVEINSFRGATAELLGLLVKEHWARLVNIKL